MTIIYERSFDANEWFVICSFLVFTCLIFILPKLFTLLESIAYYNFGILFGMFYDHTISVPPWDFYDVNDISSYQAIDFLSYVMYGPYSFFFLYIYKKLQLKGGYNIIYIIIWTSLALLMEWVGLRIELFHYNKGYKFYWSIPIYLIVQTIQLILYHLINSHKLKKYRYSPKK